jgi:hypothetical protein
MFVSGLVLDPATQAPIVVLKDEGGEIVLPIWIGVAEATSIASAIKQVAMARPLTHDLMFSTITEFGASIDRVIITELKESTYFADLFVSIGDRVVTLDSRPSDAIALALRASAPIFVTKQVLVAAKVYNTESEEAEPSETTKMVRNLSNIDKDKWAEILSKLDPEDFKFKM